MKSTHTGIQLVKKNQIMLNYETIIISYTRVDFFLFYICLPVISIHLYLFVSYLYLYLSIYKKKHSLSFSYTIAIVDDI
jgi:hypothetical protein